MKTIKKIRKMKVQPDVTFSKWKNKKEVSKLLIKGQWFTDAGFMPGVNVQVTVSDGKLIIEPCAA